MGNDDGLLSTLTYVGNAADGTSTNFGSAPGIDGDGIADGTVQKSFWLPAGDYSLIIGGGNVSGTDSAGSYGINASLSVIPEPSSAILAGLSTCGMLIRRRRSR
jgi:hypothetical protein